MTLTAGVATYTYQVTMYELQYLLFFYCAVFNRGIHCEDIPGALKIINNYYKASCQRSSLLYIRPSKHNYQTCHGRKYTRSDTRTAMGLGDSRILAGWPLRNSTTASRSSRHPSKNWPIFFASLVLKPLTVFAITESLSSIFHLDTTRWEKKYFLIS